MRNFIFVLICFCFATLFSHAQYRVNYSIRVDKGFDSLYYAWTGGLNNPQFNAVDLNDDGILDLVVFDRADNKVLTFINNGTPNESDYAYAPQYQKYFPSLQNWMLMVDFNHDGIPDIFTSTSGGIMVYKGEFVDGHITFALHNDLLYYRYVGDSGKVYWLNLPVTAIDIPAIGDFNYDGAIDIITKDIGGGTYDQFYTNLTLQEGYGFDSLLYDLTVPCWGKFYESLGSDKKLLNQPCPFTAPYHPEPIDTAGFDPNGGGLTRHSGSTTLVFDNTGNGVMDAMMGNISFNNIVYLVNGDSTGKKPQPPQDCDFTWQDTTFPSYNVPSNVITFPAPFRLDLNNDGIKDLIFAPNNPQGSNFSACAWFYKNIGNDTLGNFRFQTDSFLVNQMIDVGSGANPVFFDYNGDSLMDIVIGNECWYNSYATLTLYQNTGTKTHPRFKYVTWDYNNLSSLHLNYIHPTFGDLDGDGQQDMIVGSENGRLYYFKNTAAPGTPATFSLVDTNYFNIFQGSYSAPQLVDVNGDGLLDLLVGSLGGKIYYYQNTGTKTSPNFSTLTNGEFGNVNADLVSLGVISAFSVPCLTQLPGYNGNVLLVGDATGRLQLFDSIENNLYSGSFNRVTPYYSNITTGNFDEGLYPCSVSAADINSDGAVELMIGYYRGGIHIYDTSSVDLDDFPNGIASIVYNPNINIYPNPTYSRLTVQVDNSMIGKNWKITIANIMGQQVMSLNTDFNATLQTINTSALPPGLYIIDIANSTNKFDRKFIKQ